MAGAILAAAFAQPVSDARLRIALLALADAAMPDGFFVCGGGYLLHKTDQAAPELLAHLRALENAGLLRDLRCSMTEHVQSQPDDAGVQKVEHADPELFTELRVCGQLSFGHPGQPRGRLVEGGGAPFLSDSPEEAEKPKLENGNETDPMAACIGLHSRQSAGHVPGQDRPALFVVEPHGVPSPKQDARWHLEPGAVHLEPPVFAYNAESRGCYVAAMISTARGLPVVPQTRGSLRARLFAAGFEPELIRLCAEDVFTALHLAPAARVRFPRAIG